MVSSKRVRVWDWPTRIFKWLLVATVAIGWATNRFEVAHPNWHKWNGYVALILVLFRMLWGFFGGHSARFSSFVTRPRTVARYAREVLRGRGPRYLGHNPLGGWMSLFLLFAVAAQAVLGLFSAGGDYLSSIEGPLAHLASDATVTLATRLHRVWFNVILYFATVHIAANAFYDGFRRAGLIRAMITGTKPRADYVDASEAAYGSTFAAAICLLVAILGFSSIFLFS